MRRQAAELNPQRLILLEPKLRMLVGKGGEGLVRAQEVTVGANLKRESEGAEPLLHAPIAGLETFRFTRRHPRSCRLPDPDGDRFPKVRAIALENHRSPSNPLGVKGAGAGAIIPIGGLMANAVANALASFGAMPNQLPLSPARVWHMSSAKQSIGSSE